MEAIVSRDAGVARIKWNAKGLEEYNERQLQNGLEAVWIEFQRIVRKRASLINTGKVIKLKGKKKRKFRGRDHGLQKERKIKDKTTGVTRTVRTVRSRIPIYIPGVGWRMSKRFRKPGDKGIKNKTQITVYPNSSKPGEPVRRRTGFGQKNIVGGRRGGVARVGYTKNARYMTWHELGIRYPRGQQRRPLIIPALRDSRDRLSKLMARVAQRTSP